MAKRKVLIVVHQLNYGGVQVSLISALDAIDYDENEVTVYIRKNRIDLIDKINKNVSKVIVNEDNTRYYREPYTAFLTVVSAIKKFFKKDTEETEQKIVDYIVKKQFKYECTHYFKDPESYDVAVSYIQGYTAAFVAKHIDSERKIMFWHTSTDDHHEMHTEIIKDYDRVICVSNGAKDVIAGCYPRYADKFGVLENYVDYGALIEKSIEYDPAPPQDCLVLCSCGRITGVKGFDVAVKAAEILHNKGVDFIWYFVGDGPARESIEKMIFERGLRSHIVITGLLDNPFPYIKGCDIYVQPSYEESFGRTIKEAMILCKPVVSTRTVGALEQLADGVNGVLTDISSESLAEGIMRIVEDDDLKKSITDHLEKIDYSKEFENYRHKWKQLLES